MITRLALVIARLNIGGPATHVIELAAALPRDRYSIRVFTGCVGPKETDMHYLAGRAGVKVEIIPGLSPQIGLWDAFAFYHLWIIFRKWQPQVVHTHTAKAGALGRMAARMAGVPRIVHTFHGHVLRGYFSPPAEAFFRFVERRLASATDRIITLSPALKRDLAEMEIAPDWKIDVVPLGMELASLRECRSRKGELRTELGISQEQTVIGIVGRLVPIKNHRLFIEAARSMVDSGFKTHFLVVGDGELRDALGAYAKQLGLADCITFAGWRQDMAQVYAAIDLLSLTSENEGTPVAVMEAMAAGVPVAAAAVGGIADILAHEETGWLIYDRNPVSHASCWRDILNDPPRTRRIVQRAATFALARFGRDRMVTDLMNVYEATQDRAPGAGAG